MVNSFWLSKQSHYEMKTEKVLHSEQDNSVNFVKEEDIGFSEARYVRRTQDYFIVYLSSQTGCNRGCKFCHLTATRQTQFQNVTVPEFFEQADAVLNHYKTQAEAQEVNFNFMSRGEALANPELLHKAPELLEGLAKKARDLNLVPKFNISTIMPKTLADHSLAKVFAGTNPTIYYSLYSMNPEFRRKWMPGAMDPEKALDMLKIYQDSSSKILKLHWTFIQGENDSLEDLKQIFDAIDSRNLRVDFNLVRYNPYSDLQGKESSNEVIQRNLEYIQSRVHGAVKMVSRVGFDVKASCGMFVEKSKF